MTGPGNSAIFSDNKGGFQPQDVEGTGKKENGSSASRAFRVLKRKRDNIRKPRKSVKILVLKILYVRSIAPIRSVVHSLSFFKTGRHHLRSRESSNARFGGCCRL